MPPACAWTKVASGASEEGTRDDVGRDLVQATVTGAEAEDKNWDRSTESWVAAIGELLVTMGVRPPSAD